MEYLFELAERFSAEAPACDYWSLRLVDETSDHLEVRQGVVEPSVFGLSRGAMLTLSCAGGLGYAATSDLSLAGLRAAAARARSSTASTSPFPRARSAGSSAATARARPRPWPSSRD